ncbi:nitrous oxide reductase family maturation protein NosD [Sphingomonas sp. R86521]|uniref:right-handed parallel beta-helix repeat-containing protein n=1 Tax=Sphingomonas sp. R86521 TaxID=3093860 RepID=UPI0036D31721
MEKYELADERPLSNGGKRVDRRSVIWGTFLTVTSTACGKASGQGGSGDVRKFGAKADGVTDDGPAIQRAIDAAAEAGGGVVTLSPGTYLVRYRPSDDGDGGSALTLRSGVTIEGTDRDRCIVKLADAQLGPGSYARIVASKGNLSRAGLRSFRIDGSRQAQGKFRDEFGGAAVLLGWKGRCVDVIIENMHVHDAVGQGIMLQGTVGNLSRNLRIANNLVERTSFIGIQCSQFDGVEIVDNELNDCRDNAIDVYGDDTDGHSTVSTSHRATISGNRIRGSSIGVFLETVADCVAVRNIITDCRTAGVRVNRIHGEPRNLTIERNKISGTPIGVAMGGDTGGVVIRDNDIRTFTTAGIEFSYNVSRATVTANRFVPSTTTTPIVLGRLTTPGSTPPEQLVSVIVKGNRVPRGHDRSRLFVNQYKRVVDVVVGEFISE